MKRSRLDALVCEQEGLHSLDRDTIEAIQLKKLNRLLERERVRGGFYRDAAERLRTLDGLADLPFTTDEDLARYSSGLLLTSQSAVQRVVSDATSGTTGAAKRVFYTENDLENTVRLYMAGLGELVFPGSVTMICFPFSGPYGLGDLIADAITRLGAKPLRAGLSLSYGELSALMDKERPDTFVGLPVPFLSLLRVCGRGSLRRALVSGDACPPSVIAESETLLGSKLFPHYGSREMGMAGAVTCPAHEGMHLRENHVIAEIVDEQGRRLPDGEFGELVITTIGMEALPLIRYRTGDYTRILPEPCPCGSALLRLDTVRRGGESAKIAQLDDALFSVGELADCRVSRKDGLLRAEALAVPGADEAALREKLRARLPENTEICLRTATMEDKTLYPGKRSIVRE